MMNASSFTALGAPPPSACRSAAALRAVIRARDPQVALYRKQCKGPGSLISFCVKGGEKEAFQLLDTVREYKLAVSLGGIETLIEHPGTMTHSDMTPEERRAAGIADNMIRVSVGLEDIDDLIADMRRALDAA